MRSHQSGSGPPTSEASQGTGKAGGSGAARSYAVGFVNYRTYDDLERGLVSVKSQSLAPSAVFVVDADGDPAALAALRDRHPEVHFEPRPNGGFTAGANRLLSLCEAGAPEVAFLLLLNPDVELDPFYAERVVDAMVACPAAALAAGKLLREGGAILDSAGIVMPRHRRPRDRGSEEPDRGQYDANEFVFGASGAALMIRREAAADLAVEGQVFDEEFFMYHEDTDLSWRANLLGWRVLYVAGAEAIHARRWQKEERYRIAVEVRRHSFKNHYLQVLKNERAIDLLRGLPVLLVWEVARLGFLLLRDRGLLPAYRDAFALAPAALRKRRLLQRRAAERRAQGGEPGVPPHRIGSAAS